MRYLLFACACCLLLAANGQGLQPGFNKAEYLEMLRVSAQSTANAGYASQQPQPERFSMFYRSPVLGLDNLYDLWSDGQGVAVVSIRGTTKNQVSWLENFYAAMTPAKGEVELPGGKRFAYNLADHPQAAVHAGWLLGTAFLATDMLPRLDSVFGSGIRNLLIVGHSQGGAIAYLLTAYLRQRQSGGLLPADLRIKTYCSAAPKPGNLPFAYSYEAATRGGWAVNVVNSADWVPETPISLQTLNDFNQLNPFVGAPGTIRKMKFPMNLALKYVFNRLNKSSAKARKTYIKYLGNMTGKQVRKALDGLALPAGFNSTHYVRTGEHVVLLADTAYFRVHPNDSKNVFEHHLHNAYRLLANKLPDGAAGSVTVRPN